MIWPERSLLSGYHRLVFRLGRVVVTAQLEHVRQGVPDRESLWVIVPEHSFSRLDQSAVLGFCLRQLAAILVE